MLHYDLKYDNPDDPIIIEIKGVEYKIERCEDTLIIAEKKHEAAVVSLFKDLKIQYGDINAYIQKLTASAQAVEKYNDFAERVIRAYFPQEDAKTILSLKADKPNDVKRMYYENLIGEIESQKNKFDSMGKLM